MTTLCTCDDTVRTDDNVTVKVHIHFQCCQNHKIQFIDYSTFIKRICILTGTDAEMPGIFYRFYRVQVKVLRIQKNINLIVIQKITHRFCQTADAKSHADPALFHNLCQRNRRCNRSSSYAGLIRKSIFKIRCRCDKSRTVICHHQFSHIFCRFCRTGCDFLRITDCIYHHYIIHFGHGNMCRKVREWYQTVRDCYDFIRIIGIYHRIGQYPAVCLSTDATTVSIIITGRRSDKSNIQMYLAGLDRTDSSAMGTHHSKSF